MIEKIHYKLRSEWETIRNELIYDKVLIGASSAASAVAVNKWKSPLRLFHEYLKTVSPNRDTNTTLLGSYMENYIKQRYMCHSEDEEESIYNFKNGIVTKNVIDVDYIIKDEDRGIFASLDWITKDGDFEFPTDAKNSNYNYHKEWHKLYSNNTFDTGSAIPPGYQVQLSLQCLLTNSEYANLAVMVDGNLKIYPFYQNDKLVEFILDGVNDFRLRVIKAKLNPELTDILEPDITELEEETTTRKELSNISNGLELLGDEEDQQMRDDYKSALELENSVKKIKQKAKNHFLRKLGSYETLMLNNGKVTKTNFRVY